METTEQLYEIVSERLSRVHIGCFKGEEKPLLLISEQYPGIWLEHVYDSVFYATLDRSKLYLAENTVDIFLSHQKSDGQLPCYIWDGNRRNTKELVGYSQIQECVSFARLCLLVYKMNRNRDFLLRCYTASKKWVEWLRKNRMTRGEGLVEMFVGFDTGHDNSGRLEGLACKGLQCLANGTRANAALLPPEDGVTPILAVDMNCNYHASLVALAEMAQTLSLDGESKRWFADAKAVKEKLFALCYNEADCFFYDVDKNGKQRKYLSSTVFHLFMEGVLDVREDAELIREIYVRHIANPDEFATPFPYPSMAINDPSCKNHEDYNCWGYYTQGLIALRTTLWMERYGFTEDFERLCRRWVKAWTEHYGEMKFGQELDPVTGTPTKSSEWYSSTMLFYLYAVQRLRHEK